MRTLPRAALIAVTAALLSATSFGQTSTTGGAQLKGIFPSGPSWQDIREKIRAFRSTPQLVPFKRGNTNSELRLSAGLSPQMKLSAEYFNDKTKQWTRFAIAEPPKDTKKSWRIPVPSEHRGARLRITRLDGKTAVSQSTKFPASFRTGKTQFPPRETAATEFDYAQPLYAAGAVRSDSPAMADSGAKSASPTVEESDIWKVSGTQIYFFNQLRGLQVIETADAAEPEIISFLRMPAVGEDMYVLPGSRAVLVRRDWKNGGTTGVILVDASLPQARIVSELQVPGWYTDSRLVDGRLVLATTQWDTTTWQCRSMVSVIDDLGTAPRIASAAALDFAADAMGAGSDFLWISGKKNWSWTESTISLFPLSSLPDLAPPLSAKLGGVVYDKFKVHQNGETLFAVTQSWNRDGSWRSSTALESYSLKDGQLQSLQQLPLVEGENLHATRFDGNRAYVVTFRQIDPLWIVNLSEPAAMRVESELPVPGWSTFIQPVGEFLAAIGVDGGKVTASLFDVRDPAKPYLSSRVDIGDGFSWSEANWNEKAVAILPESGLILLPYSSFNSNGSATAVQIVDMDTATGTLTKRGVIPHAFSPRRANTLREGILASISNRELFLLDATNRDQPAIISEVTLAFGADRIFGSRDGLLVHAESGDWMGSAAVLRISSAADPDAVLAETSLGEGEVVAGALRGNHILVLTRGRQNPKEGRIFRFDAAQLPGLVETGRSTFDLDAGWNTSAEVVWPSENLAVAAVRRDNNWWRGPLFYDAAASPAKLAISPSLDLYPRFRGAEDVSLCAFDVSGATPRFVSRTDLTSIAPRNTSKFFAADGLVIFSCDRLQTQPPPSTEIPSISKIGTAVVADLPWGFPRIRPPLGLAQTSLLVTDYADPSNPVFWPETTIPGKLENITEFDRSAGLIFASNNNGDLEALLYEGGLAQSIAALPHMDVRAANGRKGWGFTAGTLNCYRLSDNGSWELEGTRSDLPFVPAAVRADAKGLLARSGDALAFAPADFSAPCRSTAIPSWCWGWSNDLSQVDISSESVFIPAGQYGIEVLR